MLKYVLADWWTEKLKFHSLLLGFLLTLTSPLPTWHRCKTLRSGWCWHPASHGEQATPRRCCGGPRPSSPIPFSQKGPCSFSGPRKHGFSFPCEAKGLCHLWGHKCCRQPVVGLVAQSPPGEGPFSRTFPDQPEGSMGTEQEAVQARSQEPFPK